MKSFLKNPNVISDYAASSVLCFQLAVWKTRKEHVEILGRACHRYCSETKVVLKQSIHFSVNIGQIAAKVQSIKLKALYALDYRILFFVFFLFFH